MTAVLVLNIVLAIVLAAALLGLLSWAIISSRGEQLRVKADARQPARRPHGARPHVPHPYWREGRRVQQGARGPVTD
jgi:hypothetical protein